MGWENVDRGVGGEVGVVVGGKCFCFVFIVPMKIFHIAVTVVGKHYHRVGYI